MTIQKTNRKPLKVWVDAGQIDRLHEIADKRGVSLQVVVRDAIDHLTGVTSTFKRQPRRKPIAENGTRIHWEDKKKRA